MKPESLPYKRLDHGVCAERPIVLMRDVWTQAGTGQRDMHYEVELGIVRSGRMRRTHGTSWTHDFEAGDIWLCGVWEPHAADVLEAPLDLIMFHVDPAMLGQLYYPEAPGVRWLSFFARPTEERLHPLSRHRARHLEVAERGAALSGQAHGLARRFGERALFMEVLFHLAVNQGQSILHTELMVPYASLAPALDLVLSEQKSCTVAQAARLCGMSSTSFSKAFLEATGLRFPDFSLRRRLAGAANELESRDTPIKAIAHDWGFSDASHFHHRFRERYRTTPLSYRHARLARLPDSGVNSDGSSAESVGEE